VGEQHERLRQVLQVRTIRQHPREEVVILDMWQVAVSTGPKRSAATKDCRRMVDGIVRSHPARDGRPSLWAAAHGNHLVLEPLELQHRRSAEIGTCLLKPRELASEPIRDRDVVRVGAGDPLISALRQSRLTCRPHAAVHGQSHTDDLRATARHERVQDPQMRVRQGSVLDHDDLVRGQGLLPEALEGTREERRLDSGVHWEQDRDHLSIASFRSHRSTP